MGGRGGRLEVFSGPLHLDAGGLGVGGFGGVCGEAKDGQEQQKRRNSGCEQGNWAHGGWTLNGEEAPLG